MLAIMFADDTNLFISGKNTQDIEKKANHELSKIVEWLTANRLSLNVTKTHFMLFCGYRKKITSIPDIKINGNSLERVSTTKFLGVTIDDHLTWKPHIHNVAGKIAKSVGIIHKARQVLHRNILLTLYNTFIMPYLLYCNLIWGKVPKTTLWPVLRLQKRAVRLIDNLKYRDSTAASFKKLGILRIPDLHEYLTAIFMYNYEHTLLPVAFEHFFEHNHCRHKYGTRQSVLLHIPIFRTSAGNRSVKKLGVQVWNSLKRSVDTSVSRQRLKNLVKKLILERY